jgi:predicted AAA+ superfamily ATPase
MTAVSLTQDRLADYPAVALVGPRQCGKTTLAQMMGGHYFDLEQEPERLRLDLDWASMEAADQLVILHEAQSWPALFPRLRGSIDTDSRTDEHSLLNQPWVGTSWEGFVIEPILGHLSSLGGPFDAY